VIPAGQPISPFQASRLSRWASRSCSSRSAGRPARLCNFRRSASCFLRHAHGHTAEILGRCRSRGGTPPRCPTGFLQPLNPETTFSPVAAAAAFVPRSGLGVEGSRTPSTSEPRGRAGHRRRHNKHALAVAACSTGERVKQQGRRGRAPAVRARSYQLSASAALHALAVRLAGPTVRLRAEPASVGAVSPFSSVRGKRRRRVLPTTTPAVSRSRVSGSLGLYVPPPTPLDRAQILDCDAPVVLDPAPPAARVPSSSRLDADAASGSTHTADLIRELEA